MALRGYITYIALFLVSLFPLQGFISVNEIEEESFRINKLIDEHVNDSHDFHVMDFNHHACTILLPVILWTDNGLVMFISSAFEHDSEGKVVVEREGQKFMRYHEDIYYANAENTVSLDEKGQVINTRPLNSSTTKNVFLMLLASASLLCLFIGMARSYKKNGRVPKGLAGFLEPLVLFVRDDIAIPNIGEKHRARYMPYLLTVFFLIWVGNLFGLIPFFPFAGTMASNILFIGILAVFTPLIILFSGKRNYWKHISAPPGVPTWTLPIMIPTEVLSIFTKPLALMIRLFANITAGHIIILSLISLVFTFGTIAISPVSMLFTLLTSALKLLVAALQAYVFTLLSALLIGQAVEKEHH